MQQDTPEKFALCHPLAQAFSDVSCRIFRLKNGTVSEGHSTTQDFFLGGEVVIVYVKFHEGLYAQKNKIFNCVYKSARKKPSAGIRTRNLRFLGAVVYHCTTPEMIAYIVIIFIYFKCVSSWVGREYIGCLEPMFGCLEGTVVHCLNVGALVFPWLGPPFFFEKNVWGRIA